VGRDGLQPAPESRDGYVRTAYRNWVDADRDGTTPARRWSPLKRSTLRLSARAAACRAARGSRRTTTWPWPAPPDQMLIM